MVGGLSRWVVVAGALAWTALGALPAGAVDGPPPPVPRAVCGPGSAPETDLQGRVPPGDYTTGRTANPYTCNTELIGHHGTTGGLKVARYVDAQGHECAYYDTTLLFPMDLLQHSDGPGTYVLDMKDPAHPALTATLTTPAMVSPHESLVLSERRGLLMAGMGNAATYPGIVDIYDIKADCLHPVLLSSTPLGILGHESGLAPDGNTLYISSAAAPTVTALDITDPTLPRIAWTGPYESHGMAVGDDGNRLYLSAIYGSGPNRDSAGLFVLDVSAIQRRDPVPQVQELGFLTWPEVTIPQNSIPFTSHGRHLALEVDEFQDATPSLDPAASVGAARIIDLADERAPKVLSNIRLEVHNPEGRRATANDAGTSSTLQGYAGHYCNIPTRVDPTIAACTFILSGLRIFDISDPDHPKEAAYFNKVGNANEYEQVGTAYAMSQPTFVPERHEVWYSDGNAGFYAIRLTNGVWGSAAPAAATVAQPAAAPPQAAAPTAARSPGSIPATGRELPLGLVAVAVVIGLGAFRLRRRAS
jgi:hypothetical protein